MCTKFLKNPSVLNENINVMDTDDNYISLMTQINDNIGSKYIINNIMVGVIFIYFINNITKD